MIPLMIPAPGVWEHAVSWNNVTALVAAYWNRGVQYSFIRTEWHQLILEMTIRMKQRS